MVSILEFQKISGIDGLKHFFLVKQDGSIVAHDDYKADILGPCVALAGLNCDAIRSLLGYSRFNYMVFSRQCKEDMVVFPMSNYFLAVIKEPNASTTDLILLVGDFIRTITNMPKDSQQN